jgi:hypothetical protein
MINLITPDTDSILQGCDAFKTQLNSQFFMIAFILVAWTIWTARNSMIFSNTQMTLLDCKVFLLKEIKLVRWRVKPSLSVQFDQWIQNLVPPLPL